MCFKIFPLSVKFDAGFVAKPVCSLWKLISDLFSVSSFLFAGPSHGRCGREVLWKFSWKNQGLSSQFLCGLKSHLERGKKIRPFSPSGILYLRQGKWRGSSAAVVSSGLSLYAGPWIAAIQLWTKIISLWVVHNGWILLSIVPFWTKGSTIRFTTDVSWHKQSQIFPWIKFCGPRGEHFLNSTIQSKWTFLSHP